MTETDFALLYGQVTFYSSYLRPACAVDCIEDNTQGVSGNMPARLLEHSGGRITGTKRASLTG